MINRLNLSPAEAIIQKIKDAFDIVPPAVFFRTLHFPVKERHKLSGPTLFDRGLFRHPPSKKKQLNITGNSAETLANASIGRWSRTRHIVSRSRRSALRLEDQPSRSVNSFKAEH
jgi:hypothetical protein